jgi:hypothetical protein
MKKTILIIALALVSAVSYGQNHKADSVKKVAPKPPVTYQADRNRVYDIHLQLTYEQLMDYIIPESQLENSDKLSGAQITDIKDFRKDTNKDIIRQLNVQAKADYDKWRADTTTTVKPKK